MRNGARTKSAINNTQASAYVRAPEGVARRYNGIKRQGKGGRPGTTAVVPGGSSGRPSSTAVTPLAGVTLLKYIN